MIKYILYNISSCGCEFVGKGYPWKPGTLIPTYNDDSTV